MITQDFLRLIVIERIGKKAASKVILNTAFFSKYLQQIT